jgi:hypothetical protein
MSLRDRLQSDFPPSWQPEVGDFIVGRLERYEILPTKKYGKKPVAIISISADDAGDAEISGTIVGRDGVVIEDPKPGQLVSVWLMHTALLSQFDKAGPRPGETIGIRRGDDRESGNDMTYADFRVEIERGADAALPAFASYISKGDGEKS